MNKSKSKAICGESRDIIYKVFIWCLAEEQAGRPLVNLVNAYKRAADFTGVSESTVRRIAAEGSKEGRKCSTPAKNIKGRPSKEMNCFNLGVIRQKIQFFYTIKKEIPTITKLLLTLQQDIKYDGSRMHLRYLLKKIGFSSKKCKTHRRQVLVEKPLIAHKRESYLHEIMTNRNLPENLQKDIIYLDESYIHSSYKLKKCWQSIDTGGKKVTASLKEKRWIIVYAGNEKGLVPNTSIVFSGHTEMNQSIFTKWVIKNLIPNIKKPSIIVMDNAPYHSVVKNKAPTSSNNIEELKQWLLENNISFDDNLRAPSLLALVKKHEPEPIYEIDEILAAYGHTVLRLPPYHYDLNPTELIQVKAKHIISSQKVGAKDFKDLTVDALNSITAETWKQFCEYVKRNERVYYERGRTLYDDIDQLVKVGAESGTDDDDDDEPMTDDLKEVTSSSHDIPSSSQTNNDEICQNVEYLDFDIL